MRTMTLEQTSDYLEAAELHSSIDMGHSIVHHGISAAGHRFTLVNDCMGRPQ